MSTLQGYSYVQDRSTQRQALQELERRCLERARLQLARAAATHRQTMVLAAQHEHQSTKALGAQQHTFDASSSQLLQLERRSLANQGALSRLDSQLAQSQRALQTASQELQVEIGRSKRLEAAAEGERGQRLQISRRRWRRSSLASCCARARASTPRMIAALSECRGGGCHDRGGKRRSTELRRQPGAASGADEPWPTMPRSDGRCAPAQRLTVGHPLLHLAPWFLGVRTLGMMGPDDYIRQEVEMKTLRVLLLVVLLVPALVVGAASEPVAGKGDGTRVDEIYAGIRDAGPRYDALDEVVSFTNEGMTIVASLVVPDGVRRPPIVLFLNGFAGDRNEVLVTGTDEYIWERLSRILAEQGLASLRIDFRGSGESDGDYTMTTFSTQISDAIAALDFISRDLRRRVAWWRTGVLGFSQGGLVGACTAARDHRVDSLCLWSPVSQAPMVYENLLLKQGLQQGLALEEGETITLPIHINGEYVDWDVPLGDAFFDQVFQVSPLAELSRNYQRPLFVLCGATDPIIWAQPLPSELYLRYHRGFEKLVMLDADHAFNWWDGSEPPRFDDAVYWSAAWFLYTLSR